VSPKPTRPTRHAARRRGRAPRLALCLTAFAALSLTGPPPPAQGGPVGGAAPRRGGGAAPAAGAVPAGFALCGFAALDGATTGGAGGETVRAVTAGELRALAARPGPLVIEVAGVLAFAGQVAVSSDKTIVGVGDGAGLSGGGLKLSGVQNVIIRNLTFAKAAGTDAIAITRGSHHVWIDHCEFWSDRDHGKDHYDGATDITRGADYVTISWSRFRDHAKAILVGSSDAATSDRGRLRVTFHHNHFIHLGSRVPSVRFGLVHVFNNLYESLGGAVNTRMGAEVLVEANVFDGVKAPIFSADSEQPGAAVERNNVFRRSGAVSARRGTFVAPPYDCPIDAADRVPELIRRHAGVGKLPPPASTGGRTK
jgi:pectate lyase